MKRHWSNKRSGRKKSTRVLVPDPSRPEDVGSGFYHNGLYHESLEDLLHTGLLNFCGCGDQCANLYYVMRGLEVVESQYTSQSGEWRSRALAHFGTQASANFFYYWLDSVELTEHGSMIPGWLTDDGKLLLGLLRGWYQEWRWTLVAGAIKQRGCVR